MGGHPIVVLCEHEEMMSYIDLIECLFDSAPDNGMFIVAILSLVITFITSVYTLLILTKQKNLQESALGNLSKQVELQNEQILQQRMQWKNDLILKEKQNVLLNFRKSYIIFSNSIRQLLLIIMPNIIIKKNQERMTINNIKEYYEQNLDDDTDLISCSYPDSFSAEPIFLYETFKKHHADFLNFVSINSVFLKNYVPLYNDLRSLLRAFSILFESDAIRRSFVEGFTYDSNTKYYVPKKNVEIRFMVLTQVFRELLIERESNDENGCVQRWKQHIFTCMGSPLSTFVFSDDNCLRAVCNEKYCFYFNCVINTWLDSLQNEIDDILQPILDEI